MSYSYWDSPKNITINKFSDLQGQTITKIDREPVFDGEGLVFHLADGQVAAMGFVRDCCASCDIEDICGDLDDLIGVPLVRAEENSSEDEATTPVREKDPDSWYEPSETWTFYRLQTSKGLVVIRWYGSSNGYYSESPRFQQVK